MIIEDEEVLDRFRRHPVCESCGRKTPKGTDSAHILTRGAGRVDIPGNVVALCRNCHMHQGTKHGPSVERLKEIASARELVIWEDIEYAVNILRKMPKNPTRGRFMLALLSRAHNSDAYAMVEEAFNRWLDRESKSRRRVRRIKKKPAKEKPAWYKRAKAKNAAYRKAAYQRIKARKKASKVR